MREQSIRISMRLDKLQTRAYKNNILAPPAESSLPHNLRAIQQRK